MKRLLAALAIVVAALGTAEAQTYPSKPVRVIVGFAPGGATDIVARLIGQKLSEQWGQPVVVENRPGGGGNVASEMVAKAPPDGYTILLGTTNTHTINPGLYASLPFDAQKDFIAITNVAVTPMALVVHKSVPAKSVTEFVSLAKAKPGELSAGTAGNGSAGHLAAELFKMMTGTDIQHVPYKGAGPAVTDLLGAHIPAMFAPLPPISAHVQSGELNLLAVTTAMRSQLFPNVPTISEAGVSGFESSSWFGFFAPAATPVPIIDKLYRDIVAQLRDAELRKRFADQALEPIGSSPTEFAAQIKVETEKVAQVLQAAGVKPE